MTTSHLQEIPGATYTTFKQLFGESRSFEVPDFQRAYDWGEDQLKDLFRDIERLDRLVATGRNVSHFCGTIICTPLQQPQSVKYAVVDGQQRLTTLALLHAKLSSKIGVRTFLCPEGALLFTPQKGDANVFTSLMQGDTPGKTSTLAQEKYLKAADEIKKWVGDDIDRVTQILEHIEHRLHFIFFVLHDDLEVAKVFETINNRGKPLSQMDLVKNHLIYLASAKGWKLPDVNEVWRRINHLSASTQFVDGDVDTVLRAVVTAQFKPGRRKGGESDYAVVLRNLGVDTADYETFKTFLWFLESSFRTHAEMRLANNSDPKTPVTRALTFLNHHDVVSGVLPLIFARQFRREDKDASTQKAQVLESIEIANFRLYGLPGASARSDSHNVTLHRLAHDYFCGSKSDDDVVADLKALVTKAQKDGIAEIVKHLTLDDGENYDYYSWPWLRYFLARFEEHLLDSQSFDFSRLRLRVGQGMRTNDPLTIEHIWPQNADKKMVAENKDGQQIRRLGNLMLLPHRLNVQLGNGDLEIKERQSAAAKVSLLQQNKHAKEAARKAKEFCVHLSSRKDEKFGDKKRRFNTPTLEANWDIVRVRTLCDLREEQMIRFALEAWRIPGEAGSGHAFEGMFSLPFGGEAFQVDKEHVSIKARENYVLSIKGAKAVNKTSAAARLEARQEILCLAMEPVYWD